MVSREKMKVLGLFFALGVVMTSTAEAEEGSQLAGGTREALARIDQGKQENEQRAAKLVAEANDLLIRNKYLEARDKYIEAVKIFEQFPSETFRQKTDWCRRQIGKCYSYMAEDAMLLAEERAQARDFEEAIAICKEAIKYSPENAAKLQSRIERYEKRQAKALMIAETSEEKLLPNLKTQQYQIQVLLEQGRQLINAKDYGKALRKFQEVLLLDPYNADAIQNVKATYARIDKIGLSRYRDEHRKMISEVEWKYSIPILPEGDSSAAKNLIDEGPKVKAEVKLSPLQQKLNSIIIPRIDFEDVTITAAVKNLRDQSRQQDPERLGVNIFLRTGGAPQVTQQNPGEEGYPPGLQPQPQPQPQPQLINNPEGEEGGVDNEQRITLLIQNKSLMDAIIKLCDTAKLRYKVEKYAVVLAPEGIALENMETRLFPMDQAPVDDPENEQALKNYFKGVDFPAGSQIVYDSRINRLIVTNTPENLQKIDEIVNELLKQQDPMIQIMAKFIEISQNDLDELAFNYQLSVNSAVSATSAAGDGKYTATRKTRWDEGSNALMRYYKTDTGNDTASDPMTDSTFSYVWANDRGTRFVASMFALNWASSEDVLSSPRVTTLPDQMATIEMVTERYFPDEWEIVDLSMNNAGGSSDSSGSSGSTYWIPTSAGPQPTFESEPTPLGIKFSITPKIVDLDRRMINADINLPILTLSGWMEYDARTIETDGSVDGEYYRMPIFDKRVIKTEVTVYDGETIVLGGVAQDTTTVVNDKIPILGDLPLVGRLFQSKYTESEKRNLLVFLTCRLVKPDGSAFFPDEDRSRGLPDFGRNH